jgi:hypothetical protein
MGLAAGFHFAAFIRVIRVIRGKESVPALRQMTRAGAENASGFPGAAE